MRYLLILTALLSVHCSKGFKSQGENDLSSQSASCFQDESVQACVFDKNPVASLGSPLASGIGASTALSRYQSRGVQITGVDDSGLLRNSSLNVTSGQGERAVNSNGSWKYVFEGDASAKAVQVHTYYWLNKTIEEMQQRAGAFYAKDKALDVVVGSDTTGWLPAQKSIRLERSAAGNQLALDAGLSIHLLGQANLYYATNGASDDLTADTSHRDCAVAGGPTYLKDCCTAKMGCSRALASGQADYLVALMFPDHPTVGESWVNRVSGFKMCEFSRDLRQHANTTAQQAFDACGASGSGQVLTMGTLYASMWFEIRKKLQAEAPARVADFDRLYMKHVSEIRGADTFVTVLAKIKTLDQAQFGGVFSTYFDAEFGRRGIQ